MPVHFTEEEEPTTIHFVEETPAVSSLHPQGVTLGPAPELGAALESFPTPPVASTSLTPIAIPDQFRAGTSVTAGGPSLSVNVAQPFAPITDKDVGGISFAPLDPTPRMNLAGLIPESKPEEKPAAALLKRAGQTVLSLPDFFTSDAGVTTALLSMVPTLRPIIGAYWAQDLLRAAYKAASDASENWDKMTDSQKAVAVLDTGVTAALGTASMGIGAGPKIHRVSPSALGETVAAIPKGPEGAATAIRVLEAAKEAPPEAAPPVPPVVPERREQPSAAAEAVAAAGRTPAEVAAEALAAGKSAPEVAAAEASARAQEAVDRGTEAATKTTPISPAGPGSITPEPPVAAVTTPTKPVAPAGEVLKPDVARIFNREYSGLVEVQKRLEEAQKYEPETVEALKVERDDIIQRLGEFDRLFKQDPFIKFEDSPEVATAKALRDNPSAGYDAAVLEGQRLRKQNIEDRIFDGDEPIPDVAKVEFPDLFEKPAAPAAQPAEVPSKPSLLLDKKGKPLVVHHGSPIGDIAEFKPKEGGALYFSSSKTVGQEYTVHRGMWNTPSKEGKVYSVNLSMDNPLVIDALGTRNDNIPVPWQEWKPKVFGNLPKNALSVEDVVKYAKDHGHDGVIIKNVIDTVDPQSRKKSDVYAVFDPQQIKPIGKEAQNAIPKREAETVPVAEAPGNSPEVGAQVREQGAAETPTNVQAKEPVAPPAAAKGMELTKFKGTTLPPETKSIPPNSSFIKVVDYDGRTRGFVVFKHDGTPEGIRKAHKLADAYVNQNFAWKDEFYNTDSQRGATDETGQLKWVISPNGKMSEVGTPDAAYALGDVKAFDRDRVKRIMSARESGDIELADKLISEKVSELEKKASEHEGYSTNNQKELDDAISKRDAGVSVKELDDRFQTWPQYINHLKGHVEWQAKIASDLRAESEKWKSKLTKQATPAAAAAVNGKGSVYESTQDGKPVWMVQEGDQRGFGDSIWKSKEEAEKQASIIKRRDKEHSELEAKQSAERERIESILREQSNLDGFDADMTSMKRGRAISVLRKSISNKGRVISVRDLVREKVNEGRTVEKGEKPIGRKLINDKGEYVGEDAIGKIAMDYAEYLIKRKQQSTTPAATEMREGPGATTAGAPASGGKSEIEQLTDAFSNKAPTKERAFQLIRESFDYGRRSSAAKDTFSKALNGLKESGKSIWTTLTGFEKPDDLLKAKGELSAALESRGWRVREFAKAVKADIPDVRKRNAIAKWVDAGGDDARLALGEAATKPEYKQAYRDARNLSPEDKIKAQNIQNFFEARLQEAVDAGVLETGLQDYIHRIYPKDTPTKRKALAYVQSGILSKNPGLARKRFFEFDYEAEAAGLHPVQDFLPRITDYETSLSKAIAAREFVKKMTTMTAPDGRPVIGIKGVGVPVEDPSGVRTATVIKPLGDFRKAKDPSDPLNYRGDYVNKEYGSLSRWKWAGTDTDGKPIFVQGDVAIHPDFAGRVQALLEPSHVRFGRYPRLGSGLLTASSTVKQTMLDLSGFHQVQIALHGLEHRVNPFRLVQEIDFNDPKVDGLLKGGLTLGGEFHESNMGEGLVGRSMSQHIPVLGPILESYHNWLFQSFIPRTKLTMGIHALERNRVRYAKELASGRMTEDDLNYLTAKQANAAFGELNYIMLERSKTTQDLARLIMLAPDFLEARGRFVGQALTKYGTEQRVALLLGAFAMYAAARVLNKIVDDQWHLEPENAFSLVKGNNSYSLRTVQGDVIHMLTKPLTFWLNRLNPVYTRSLLEIISQRDQFGRKRTLPQILGDTISTVVPISLRSSRERHLWESLLNAFGVNARRYNDVQNAYQIAEAWKKKNNVREAPGEFIYDSDKDPLRPLKLALSEGDDGGAVKEIKRILEGRVMNVAKLDAYFQRYAKAPFSGSHANESKFMRDLSEDERKTVLSAQQHRANMGMLYRQAKQKYFANAR